MKKQQYIYYSNEVKTSKYSLILLVILSYILGLELFLATSEVDAHIEAPQIQAETSQKQVVEVQIITTSDYEALKKKELHLANLRTCESGNNDFAVGDAGKSVGPYQWQKATLEDKLGYTVTYQEYYDLVTNYKFIYDLTYKTYYEDGEWWRWYNCSIKLGYKKI